MRPRRFQRFNVFNELIVENISRNRKMFLLYVLCVLTGVILGLFFTIDLTGSFFTFDYANRFFNIVFVNNISIITVIFDRVFINFQLFLLLFIFSLHFFMAPLHYVFILYRSYILSSTAAIIISLYGVLGVVNVILLIVPQQLITLFFLINFSIMGIKNSLNNRRYKGFFDFKSFVGKSLCFYLISLLTVVLDIFLIYIIIRPFNLGI